MIIGLTGSYCSGKDTAADYIVEKHGFTHYSLSDIIRESMKEEGIEPTRENLIVFGTNLRAQNGNGVLAKKAMSKMQDNQNYCITSIRHPDEINEFRNRKDFILINVDAPQNVRFERMRKRSRDGDPETLEKFVEFEKKESQSEGSGQQLVKCAEMADITFINDADDIAALNAKIEDLLAEISNRLKRQNV
ncbi:MAG: AAA family ATPase [Endomicrobia bacterium]|nr:AAA family ATPase [Endomicrobiia bacterium]